MRQIAFEANNLTTSTRRNTHNAPPDLRPKIARPSSNRLSHMHLSLADRYLGRPTRLPKTWTQLACRPYEILSKPKRQNSFFFLVWHLDNLLAQVGRTLLGLFSHHWRREFFWHLDDLSAQIGRILLGRVYGRRHGATHITRRPTCAERSPVRLGTDLGLRPTTRRDTHNAPPDLRR